jgi:hypothetical protein
LASFLIHDIGAFHDLVDFERFLGCKKPDLPSGIPLCKWSGRFAEVYDDHLLPTCDQTDFDVDEIISILGEDWFMRTVWGCAFEDFLTRDFDDGSNVVDDYLKRRGWKEAASTRAYMAALRTSVCRRSFLVTSYPCM